MRNVIFFVWLLLVCNNCFAQSDDSGNSVHLIPEPVTIMEQPGVFMLKSNTKIYFDNDQLKDVSQLFLRRLNKSTGYHFFLSRTSSKNVDNTVLLKINNIRDIRLGNEGYCLQVSPRKIVISANDAQGVFYGIQSLMQLLPPQIEADDVIHDIKWEVPCVTITDYPRFKWRGMMVDESRHFFGKKAMKQYINALAKYKYNIFHWHLTDDQGWRIEIKGLPELTEVGAWRVPRTGRWGTFKAPEPGEKATYGGYYTQEDIKEIIQYAKERFITILPEIDVPGHCLALIAAYPNLSTTQIRYPVWPQHSPREVNNVLDVANDSTWLILDKIFTQVADLFPGDYIHVGGDEADRSFWMKDSADLALMKREGITTAAGLQSYFEKKLEKLIVSKGKKMIGWDEILEGGLAPEATVMSWRGVKWGVKASQMNHHVIMSPYSSTYLSQIQGNPLIEPHGPGMITLQKCYETNILPEGVDPKFVMGGEGCLWSEHISNYRHLEYMSFPRALALSEVLWSPKHKMKWNYFVHKVEEHFPYLQAAGIKYATSIYDPMISAIRDRDSIKIVLNTQVPGLRIYYTFDGTDPDNFYPEYEGKPLCIPEGATAIRVSTYRDNKPVGSQADCQISWLEERLKSKKH